MNVNGNNFFGLIKNYQRKDNKQWNSWKVDWRALEHAMTMVKVDGRFYSFQLDLSAWILNVNLFHTFN